MIIWGALGIPLVFALVLYVFYDRKTVWWEPLVTICVCLLLIAGSKACIETSAVQDTEYHGGWITHVESYEPWNKKVDCDHTISCSHYYRDKDGHRRKRHWNDGHRHAFDVQNVPPEWYAHDSNGRRFTISQATFETYATNFDNRTFVELNRDYYSQDGDKYESRWLNIPSTMVPTTVTHQYTNTVQTSAEFSFPKVDPKVYGLFDYPPVQNGYQCPAILGDVPGREVADLMLQRVNARLGAAKQVRLWILVYRDKPIEAGLDQEAYWKGGNKNEFVITIGIDGTNTVRWCHIFSWTEQEGLKQGVGEMISNSDTLDLPRIIEWLDPQIAARFVRKPFAEFNRLTVDPPRSKVIAVYILTLLVSLLLSFWIVGNDATE